MKVSDCLFSFQEVYGLPIANMSFDSLILTLDQLINLEPFFDALYLERQSKTSLNGSLVGLNTTIKDLRENGTMVGSPADTMISPLVVLYHRSTLKRDACILKVY